MSDQFARPNSRSLLGLGCSLLLACSGGVIDAPFGANCKSGTTECVGGPGGGATGGSNGGSLGNAIGSGDGASASFLPARLRKLTNDELEAAASSLLGTTTTLTSGAPDDVRQAYFARNDAAAIDGVVATALRSSANALAAKAVDAKARTLAPCSATDTEGCARTFISTFAARAFRRPATSDEVEALVAVFRQGRDNSTRSNDAYGSGIELVVETVLQAPDFLYLDESGDGQCVKGLTRLNAYQLASSLAFLVTGGPPDSMLSEAASTGALLDADTLRNEVRRLMATPAGSRQLARFVSQWLGLDNLTPGPLSASMAAETNAFVADVYQQGGGLPELLSAPYSFVDAALAELYGVNPPSGTAVQRVALTDRLGLLNQAAFLTINATVAHSSPTKRGHTVRSRLLCTPIPPPDPSLKVNMTLPPAGAAQTTREVYEVHARTTSCQGCHNLMDPIGYGFERFDREGRSRSEENGYPIDDSCGVSGSKTLSNSYPNGSAMVQALANSSDVAECYTSSFFHFAAARSTSGLDAAFEKLIAGVPSTTIAATVEALVVSDLFTTRSCAQ